MTDLDYSVEDECIYRFNENTKWPFLRIDIINKGFIIVIQIIIQSN